MGRISARVGYIVNKGYMFDFWAKDLTIHLPLVHDNLVCRLSNGANKIPVTACDTHRHRNRAVTECDNAMGICTANGSSNDWRRHDSSVTRRYGCRFACRSRRRKCADEPGLKGGYLSRLRGSLRRGRQSTCTEPAFRPL